MVLGGDLEGQDPFVFPLSYHAPHTEISMTGLSVKRQTHHLFGQILERGDVEGSQNTIEIDGKRLAILPLLTMQ